MTNHNQNFLIGALLGGLIGAAAFVFASPSTRKRAKALVNQLNSLETHHVKVLKKKSKAKKAGKKAVKTVKKH